MKGRRRSRQGVPPRGRAPGSVEHELDEDDEWRVKDPTFSQYPELARELRDADALCEQYFGTRTEQEGGGGDARVVPASGIATARDGDAVAAETAASVHLEEELAGRDEERARRYVATVRPAMAALRYVRPVAADGEHTRPGDEPRLATEEGGSLPTSDEEQKTEEGGDPGAAGGMPGSEEGSTPASGSEASALSDTESINEGGGLVSASSGTVPTCKDDGEVKGVLSIARVRRVAKQKKRAAKRLRVANAELRKRAVVKDTKDVTSVVTALDDERRTRRAAQCSAGGVRAATGEARSCAAAGRRTTGSSAACSAANGYARRNDERRRRVQCAGRGRVADGDHGRGRRATAREAGQRRKIFGGWHGLDAAR